MSSIAILGLVLVLLLVLLMTGIPVSFALAASGTAGIILTASVGVAGRVLATTPFSTTSSYSLTVVPMFILLGMFALRAGLARDLFAIAKALLSWLPGGLGIAAVAACAGFAAVTGSSIATVATLGRLSVTEMSKYGYNRNFAAATVAAGGTLGVLIPPSIIVVIYGIMTMESIGALLIAGIIPGILTAIAYATVVVIRVRLNPSLVGEKGNSVPEMAPDSSKRSNKGGTLYSSFMLVTLFAVVMGSIYMGWATATEAGAVGAFIAMLFLVVKAGSARQLLRSLREAVKETVSLTGMIFMILIGASIFSYFLVLGGIPGQLSRWVVSLELHPVLIVALLVMALLPLGMFLDSLSILVITVPLIYEPIMALGFDGIWLGIVVVKLIEIGMITPPVGMNVFVASGVSPGLAADKIFRHAFWFVIADLLIVVLFFIVPGLITWLPAQGSV